MDALSDKLRLLVQRRELLVDVSGGVTDRRELATRSDDSKSTVYRALKDLSDADLLTECHGHYDLTALGMRLFGLVRSVYAVAAVLDDVDCLREVPEFDLVDPRVFEGATVTTTERYAPNKPLEPVYELRDRSEELVGFTPVLVPQMVAEFEEGDSDIRLELVVEADSLSTATPGHVPAADYLGVVEDRLPFGLFVSTAPTRECCVVFLEDGLPRATIRNATESASQWALGVYHRYRRSSQPAEQWWSDDPATAADVH